ncbi:MAG: FAD-dependent oxidoreductase [Bacteroidota bacterium]
MERDGANKSLWQKNVDNYVSIGNVDHNFIYDVIIVGGGITGLTTALLLQHAGKKCLLAESHSIGFGTTGGTTAHLNTFFDTPYNKVIKDFGLEKAKLLSKGAAAAIALIKQNIHQYDIDCEFSELEGYLFSTNEKQDKELDEIVDAAKTLRVDVEYCNNLPVDIPYLKCATFAHQAQFNPIKYIFALAKAFEDLGGCICQQHKVTNITNEKDALRIETSRGVFRANNVIYATHIPPGVNLLHFRCAPYRSYAMAVKLKDDKYPQALAYDMFDPYHYYRTQKVDDEYYLIVGGEDHKTGHEENTDACFRRLESHAKSYFNVKEVAYKWSSQYFEPADGLPYIGKLPGTSDNIYVATGFGGNGMIYGTLSAIIFSNILVNGESVYQNLFDPSRLKPIAGFSNFVKEAADVVANLIGGKFSSAKIKQLTDLAAGEAKVVKFEGHTLALYKDENHVLHALNSACTHINCTVSWNATERSWDCPCHGSRFSIDGRVLTAPARKDLEKIDLEEKMKE